MPSAQRPTYGILLSDAQACLGECVDRQKIMAAVQSILEAIGEDPQREGLRDTPRRVADMYAEVFAGLRIDPGDYLKVGFEEHHKEMVVLRDIRFTSMCEH